MNNPPVILCVDDDKDMLALEFFWLKAAGYKPVGAESPAQAIALAQEARPDLILMDVMMPKMDG
jgi:CheY-like chemotaxis protein